MSEPTVVVVPVSGDSVQHSDQETAGIASTIQHALHERAHLEPEQPGLFKKILAHPDSLYKYINWEDPIRTLGLYIGALSILVGAHYLPLTQVVLKGGVTTLGVVSVTEFASRLFSASSLSTRLRPKEYKQIPESTLNATLKDIHDFIQYAVVQAQRIVFGQDLGKTFAAFLGFTVLYWLTKVVSPFWLIVMGLTSIFVAPFVSSQQGRAAAHDASVRAQELSNAAAEQGRVLAKNGQVKAAELSSKGKQTAADLSAQARGTASDISGTATENVRKLPQIGTNAINKAPGIVSSAFGDAKGYIGTPPSNNFDGNSNGNRRAANKVSHLSNSGSETAKWPDSDHLQNVALSPPAQTDSVKTGSVAGTGLKYAASGDTAHVASA